MPRYVRGRLQLTLSSTVPDRRQVLTVPDGEIWQLLRVTVEDETTNATYFRLYALVGEQRRYEAEQLAPVADHLYVDADPIILGPNESLGLEYSGHTAGDVVVVNWSGWSHPVDGARMGG